MKEKEKRREIFQFQLVYLAAALLYPRRHTGAKSVQLPVMSRYTEAPRAAAVCPVGTGGHFLSEDSKLPPNLHATQLPLG